MRLPVKPIVLFPSGLPEAHRWLQRTFALPNASGEGSIDLQEVEWTEWLKLGVHLSDTVVHIRPLLTKDGIFSGAFAGGEHGRNYHTGSEQREWLGLDGSIPPGREYDPQEMGGSVYRMGNPNPLQLAMNGGIHPGRASQEEDLRQTREQLAMKRREMEMVGLKGADAFDDWKPGDKVKPFERVKAANRTWRRDTPVSEKTTRPEWMGGSYL